MADSEDQVEKPEETTPEAEQTLQEENQKLEEPLSEDLPSEEPSSEDKSSEEPSSKDKPSEEPSSEDKPSEEPSSKDKPSEEPSSEDKSSKEPLSEEKPSEEPSSEDKSSKEPLSEEKPSVEGAVGGVSTQTELRPKYGRFRTTRPDEGVDLLIGKEGMAAAPPITIPQYFEEAVERNGAAPALKVKRGQLRTYTYQQYKDNVMAAAKSLLKIGVERYHGVGIIGFNAPEWLLSAMGAVYAGGLCAGIYTTSTPEACQYILNNCKANVCVVENQKQLDKILQVWERLPNLKAIVQYTGELAQKYDNVYLWDEFLELGKDIKDEVVEDIVKSQKPEDCAVMVYTSGTTGPPKGVMLSHDNVTWTCKSTYATYPEVLRYGAIREPSLVSYLPLSHIAAMMVDVIYPLGINACVYFAQPDALKGTLVNTLREARPTLFFGVPRVWEKMMERMKEVGASVTGLKRTLADWAKKVALEGNQNRQKGNSVPWGWTVANMLVLKKVHEALGLSRCMLSICGSAPVTAETLEFFSSVNIPILEVYGMSENTGPHTINRPRNGYWRSGSVGKPLEGMELKIDNPDENGDGEVLMRGRHVFMGYLELEEKTKEALDNDRWLHTGDIGRIDPDGFLYITGRIKELIITSGGENIPPVPIENVIKASVPFLSNVMLIGDKRKFLTCLITLKCVVDPDTGAPTDELLVEAKQALSALGVKYEKVSEVVAAKDEKVDKAIMDGIGVYNENHAVSRAQKVQKYYLLDTDFSVPGEELGPTLKLKRHTVVKKYAQQISSMYPE